MNAKGSMLLTKRGVSAGFESSPTFLVVRDFALDSHTLILLHFGCRVSSPTVKGFDFGGGQDELLDVTQTASFSTVYRGIGTNKNSRPHRSSSS